MRQSSDAETAEIPSVKCPKGVVGTTHEEEAQRIIDKSY
jgi:hypothetical protein